MPVLGWCREGEKSEQPRLGSMAPYTMRPIWAQFRAPAHIGQGSTVTYKVHSGRYFPPMASVAAVMAIISA